MRGRGGRLLLILDHRHHSHCNTITAVSSPRARLLLRKHGGASINLSETHFMAAAVHCSRTHLCALGNKAWKVNKWPSFEPIQEEITLRLPTSDS